MPITETRVSQEKSPVQVDSFSKKTVAFPQDWKTWEREVSKLIARTWLDEEFYDRLVNDPVGTLREAGLVLEDFVQVEINRDPNAFPVLRGAEGGVVIYELPLPPKPPQLDDETLRAWVEGSSDVVPMTVKVCC
ncbi:hypothetical protein [Aerosakkonema funiforme]|uniref:hypothetical protein n=1 Tax=Aerosakkonema funiforme TaxID=1246630 RepID=UPI0035B6B605